MGSARIILVLIAAIAVLIVFRITMRKTKTPDPPDLNAGMQSLAERAVKYAADQGVKLDYSAESVQRVELLLASLHQARVHGKLSDDEVSRHAARFGAYIGEVLRCAYGGHWTQDHDVAGPNSFPFHWKSAKSFPVGWCGKRILNGEEDNVWHKFQIVTSDALRPEQPQK